jgi:type IV secretion system protein VirD4
MRLEPVARRWLGAAGGLLVGMQAASQFLAWSFANAQALGPGLRVSDALTLYPPWSAAVWRSRFLEAAPDVFAAANVPIILGLATGLGLGLVLAGEGRERGGWGGLAEARRAGLFARGGCVLGQFKGRLLATDDLRPTLVTGATRSGKGRGHVIPTLLAWPQSALVHDPKGELWRLTAGFRGGFSHVLCFNPRDLNSARWNPLAEIAPGPGELAQVQRLVAILADPAGRRDDEAIWDKAASEILEAVILHVLYTAQDDRKSLLTVRELLADLDSTTETMVRTRHLNSAEGEPRTHPFILTAARGYGAMHDRFRTSVQGTARSYLRWLAGEDVERALTQSDFRLGDLMCAPAPVSLYVQLAPADAAALRPLVRLLFHAATQTLTAHETTDPAGRPKRHQLLLLMDEFPLLGRVEFFEKSLRLMSGYGLKAMFVAQSLNDIIETYGPNNTILDNCRVFTAFSALDPLTQDKVSRLTGTVGALRTSRSAPQAWSAGGASVTRAEYERSLLEPGDIRGLDDRDQLVFVAGFRPFRARKLRYDQREPFRSRAKLAPPELASGPDTPWRPLHPWAGRRALGEDQAAGLPLFKENKAAIQDRKAASKVAEIYDQVASELAAQQAALDHLQGLSNA